MSSGRKPDIDNIYDEYIDQIGKIVAGTVKGFHRGDIITDLTAAMVEAILPRSERARHERFSQGERIQVLIINVHKRKGPQVEVSRTSLPNRT